MSFAAGSVVWTKCGSHFWPAVVQDESDLEEDVRQSLDNERKRPKIIVKFLDEDGYEFLKSDKNIFEYECERKTEFIRKGLVRSRAEARNSNSWFAKFPRDVVRCETMVSNGDPHILEKEPFLSILGANDNSGEKNSPKKTPGRRGRPKKSQMSKKIDDKDDDDDTDDDEKSSIVHPRFVSGVVGPRHNVKILPQPSTPLADVIAESKKESNNDSFSSTKANKGSPALSEGAGAKYTCPVCGTATSRLNVMIMCAKTCKQRQSTPQSSGRGGKRGGRSGGRDPKSSRKRPRATTSSASPSTPKTTKRPRKSVTTLKAFTPKPATTTPKRSAQKKAPKAVSLQKVDVRATILNDWSEEEGEEKERRQSVIEDSDEEEQSFMMDDNVRGNVFEGEDDKDEQNRSASKKRKTGAKNKDVSSTMVKEAIRAATKTPSEAKDDCTEKVLMPDTSVEETIQKIDDVASKLKDQSGETTIADTSVEELTEKPDDTATKEVSEAQTNSTPKTVEEKRSEEKSPFDFDIGKVLEETKVPELPASMVPELPSAKAPELTKAKKIARKSVSFSEHVRELRSKKMRIVQPVSNLEAPPQVDDEEFDEFFNAKSTPEVIIEKRSGGRRILKKVSSKSDTENPEIVKNKNINKSVSKEGNGNVGDSVDKDHTNLEQKNDNGEEVNDSSSKKNDGPHSESAMNSDNDKEGATHEMVRDSTVDAANQDVVMENVGLTERLNGGDDNDGAENEGIGSGIRETLEKNSDLQEAEKARFIEERSTNDIQESEEEPMHSKTCEESEEPQTNKKSSEDQLEGHPQEETHNESSQEEPATFLSNKAHESEPSQAEIAPQEEAEKQSMDKAEHKPEQVSQEENRDGLCENAEETDTKANASEDTSQSQSLTSAQQAETGTQEATLHFTDENGGTKEVPESDTLCQHNEENSTLATDVEPRSETFAAPEFSDTSAAATATINKEQVVIDDSVVSSDTTATVAAKTFAEPMEVVEDSPQNSLEEADAPNQEEYSQVQSVMEETSGSESAVAPPVDLTPSVAESQHESCHISLDEHSSSQNVATPQFESQGTVVVGQGLPEEVSQSGTDVAFVNSDNITGNSSMTQQNEQDQ